MSDDTSAGIELLLRKQPIEGRMLFVDMNSFFASVEQQHSPELRGKPVGVCPFINDATCVLAASIEAKRYGIKTGMKIYKARRLCPEIVLVENNTQRYRKYHRDIMAALGETRCQVTIKSIDEALLQVPRDSLDRPLEVAAEVRAKIHTVGSSLRSSIGIGSNMFLGKMATNMYKPDGLMEVKLADLEAFYSLMELTDLHGISWRMARRLQAIGIETPLQFYQAPHALLKKTFGIPGERWYLRLRGYEVDQLKTNRVMIGHQTTITPQPAHTVEEILNVANQLTYRAATRLRAAELAAMSVGVYVRYTDRTYWGRALRTHSPFFDSRTFFDHVKTLFARYKPPKPVRLVSVTAFDLTPMRAMTQSLFDPTERAENLSIALDNIAHRYGRYTIVPARHMLTKRLHEQVGFGNASHTAVELQ